MQLDISEPSFSSAWLTIIFTSYSYSSFTLTTIYPKHCCWMNLLEKQRIMKTKSTRVWISSFFWSLVWLGTPQKSYNFQIWIANMTVLPVFNLLSFQQCWSRVPLPFLHSTNQVFFSCFYYVSFMRVATLSFYKYFFLRGLFLKSLLYVLPYCLHFVLFLWLQGMWDPSFQIRDGIHSPLHWDLKS